MIIMIDAIVWLMLVHDNKILLQKRVLESGLEYGLIGGHVEQNESLKQALIREVLEESGIAVKDSDLSFQYLIDRKLDNSHKVHFFFYANTWEGRPYNKESDKHMDISWHPLNELPQELGPLSKLAIQSLINHHSFSEYGW